MLVMDHSWSRTMVAKTRSRMKRRHFHQGTPMKIVKYPSPSKRLVQPTLHQWFRSQTDMRSENEVEVVDISDDDESPEVILETAADTHMMATFTDTVWEHEPPAQNALLTQVALPIAEPLPETLTYLRPLENRSGTMCYANAIVLCLFNLRRLFSNEIEETNVLRELKRLRNLETNTTRTLVGILNESLDEPNQFNLTRQQDASEFWLKLFEQLPRNCQQYFTYEKRSTIICLGCGHRRECPMEMGSLFRVSFDRIIVDMDVGDALSQSQRSPVNVYCIQCKQKTLHCQQERLLCKQPYLVVQLDMFNGNGPKIDRQLLNQKTDRLLVGGYSFRTIGAVLRHGNEIDRGHFSTICRSPSGNSRWTCVDDAPARVKSAVKFERNLRRVYLLFLENCSH